MSDRCLPRQQNRRRLPLRQRGSVLLLAMWFLLLLSGIAIGIAVKAVIHLVNGAPVRSLFRLGVDVQRDDEGRALVRVKDATVFSTWIGLKKRLDALKGQSDVVLDLSETVLVDHTVMEKLQEMEKEFKEQDANLVIKGLEQHRKVSDYPTAAHIRRPR